jgi:hypothetical protein
MPASYPASMVNQKQADLGIPNRFNLTPSRFKQRRSHNSNDETHVRGGLARSIFKRNEKTIARSQ